MVFINLFRTEDLTFLKEKLRICVLRVIHNMSRMSLEEKFKNLYELLQSLPKDCEFHISNESKFKFYAYYKQACEGDCHTPQPYFFNVAERAKWDAWNSVEGLSKEDAMQDYIDEMKEVYFFINLIQFDF